VVSGLRICEGAVGPFRQVGLHRVNWLTPDTFQLGATVGAMRGDGSLSALRATGGLFHGLPISVNTVGRYVKPPLRFTKTLDTIELCRPADSGTVGKFAH
jgi:hypothetical protein